METDGSKGLSGYQLAALRANMAAAPPPAASGHFRKCAHALCGLPWQRRLLGNGREAGAGAVAAGGGSPGVEGPEPPAPPPAGGGAAAERAPSFRGGEGPKRGPGGGGVGPGRAAGPRRAAGSGPCLA